MTLTGLVLLATLCSAPADANTDFDTQIVPLFTKAGCNVAACHGAAAGRGGFKLSLWGLNPAADYDAIVHELEGRRVNFVRPEESLLLLKSTGLVDHGGENALDNAPEGEERISAWIRAGGRRLPKRRLQRLDVTPSAPVTCSVGSEVPLAARAAFADGTNEVVSPWTVFLSNDPASVQLLSDPPRARVLRGGRHVVLARYLDRVVPIILAAPLTDRDVHCSPNDRRNFIDDHVLQTLKTLRIPVSPLANDYTLVRRIYLDFTGRLPAPEQVTEYVQDKGPGKRERLIDRLMASDEFVDLWTYRLAKLLRIRAQPRDKASAAQFHRWLRRQLEESTPYNVLVSTMLTADGDTQEYGPANFYRVATGARAQAEYVSELLMGARMRCANCHDHPLDRWTQDDYHGLAAIFARVEQGRVIKLNSRGSVTHPRTGEPARPKIPGGDFLEPGSDPRHVLAAWMTSRDNPYFARAFVNRLWKAMMGRGLAEPTDDMRDTNPPTHPELLDHLVTDFIEHGWNIRHTLRTIANSAAYGRSSTPVAGNETDQQLYSHALVRPLEPEVLADALASVTGVWDKYGDLPPGTRAVTLVDPQTPSVALDILGRCSREESCEGHTDAGSLAQTLHMINGPLINAKISSPGGVLSQLLDAKIPNGEVLDQLYLRALARPPSDNEREYWTQQLRSASGDGRRQLFEDITWSLLACREFITNH